MRIPRPLMSAALASSLVLISGDAAWSQQGYMPPPPDPSNGRTEPVIQQSFQQPAQPQSQPEQRPATDPKLIEEWFGRYDQIRRQAQMNPQEKNRANELLSKGLSIIIPGQEKETTRKLLSSLVSRYQTASEQMKLLPLYHETEQLHRGYYQYFSTAGALFADYLKVQGNILVPDASGNPLASTLMPRKQGLENLEQQVKALDGNLRARFGIPAYKY
ncbi:MAG: hypothetical protein KC777_03560 [Cyanobacteria bacterium HKST-UBA02]|nr:hypothetical protein [Cyanobacteria bacterium HKST-UBA02]